MGVKSKIELQGLVERIISMHAQEHKTIYEIARSLKKEGFDVSRSGVGRCVKKNNELVQAWKDKAGQTAELIKALQNTFGGDIMEANGQLLQMAAFDAFKDGEAFAKLKPAEQIAAWSRFTQALVRIEKLKLDYEKGYRMGLFKAAEAVEEAAKRGGWSREVISQIKEGILKIGAGTGNGRG